VSTFNKPIGLRDVSEKISKPDRIRLKTDCSDTFTADFPKSDRLLATLDYIGQEQAFKAKRIRSGEY
jgi:hypothetical protein